MSIQNYNKRRVIFMVIALAIISIYYFSIPRQIFRDPLSVTLYDKDNILLGAKIARDGQWRFKPEGEVPDKYIQALLTYEDKRFFQHPGFDLRAIVRATRDNLRARKIISGGSTITMQVISLSRKRKARNIPEKIWEIVQSTRLELGYSKLEILALYASHAPYGGNVVGLDAACWRYFNKDKEHLSWAEAALLAVLPNSPSLIHPGRNRDAMRQKRNSLLEKMAGTGVLDGMEAALAMEEELPEAPHPLPRIAPHLLERIFIEQPGFSTDGGAFKSTVSYDMQMKANHIARRYNERYKENQVHNLSLMIAEVQTGKVVAYVGNAPHTGKEFSEEVDIIMSPRSTGSLLKPFLYNWMLEKGEILPDELVADIPVYMRGFRPENFNKNYDGAVKASVALSRSLNIPFALLLQQYGVDRFHRKLKQADFRHLTFPSGHYGLALVLGGAECNLWEVCNAFAALSQSAQQMKGNIPLSYQNSDTHPTHNKEQVFHPGASWLTLEAMSRLERPIREGQWQRFYTGKEIAWKTGTSHGFRDAWAVGTDAQYVVGVWVGNAHGEGRPGILGIEAAAPLLFDLFNMLPGSDWFKRPDRHLTRTDICEDSGMLSGPYCPSKKAYIPKIATEMKTCGYHKLVSLHKNSGLRVHSNCVENSEILMQPWFVLPSGIENYYKKYHPGYQSLPGWKEGCRTLEETDKPMQWIYPKPGMTLTLPSGNIDQDGMAVFKIAHRNPLEKVFWFEGENFLGTTYEFHELALRPSPGRKVFTCVDEAGNEIVQSVEVIWTNETSGLSSSK